MTRLASQKTYTTEILLRVLPIVVYSVQSLTRYKVVLVLC